MIDSQFKRALIKIDIASGFADRLILGFFQSRFEFAIEELRLIFYVGGALVENCFSPFRLLPQERGGVIKIQPASFGRRGLMAYDFGKICVNGQLSSAARAFN